MTTSTERMRQHRAMMQQRAKAQADSLPPSADEASPDEATDADVEVGSQVGGTDGTDEDMTDLLLVEALLVHADAVKELAAALRSYAGDAGGSATATPTPISTVAASRRDANDASLDVTAAHTDDDTGASFAITGDAASVENLSPDNATVSEPMPGDSAQANTPSLPTIDFDAIPPPLRPHLLGLGLLVEHLPPGISLADLVAAFEQKFGNPAPADNSTPDDW